MAIGLMSSRFVFPILIGTLALTSIVVLSAVLLLRACAINLPFVAHLSTCVPPETTATQNALQVAAFNGQELQRRVFELERELAALQCERPLWDPEAPLTPEGWENRDLSMLYGCWNLDTTYRTRDVDSGEIRTYDQWQMCFDAEGNGTQTMRSTDGIVCEGPVTADFSDIGLNFREPGNLSCQDGGFIHQRQIACVPAPEGRATCDTLQPETKGQATVGFERAPL